MSTVLITGASSGIGMEFARVFASHGYDLVLVARRGEMLESLKNELSNVSVTIIVMDLTLQTAPYDVYTALNGTQIDILVNNAGFGEFGYFHEADTTVYENMIHLNVRTLTTLTHLFGKDMVSRRSGKILNVASTAAFQPGPLMSVYFATKHYVLAFSEGIAEEWSDFGVQVTALCPGPTQSGFQSAAHAESNSMFEKKLPTSKVVAEYGYTSLMAGRRVAVHGLMNRIMASSVRFTPRWLIVKIVRKIQEKK